MVAACIKADTGVGPAIASGSQVNKGICALDAGEGDGFFGGASGGEGGGAHGGCFLTMDGADGPGQFSAKAVNPIVRLAMERHDSENPKIVRTIRVADAVGEIAGEVTANGRADLAKKLRAFAGFGDQAFDLIVETTAEFRADLGLALRGLRVVLISLGVEGVRLHRPTIFRMRSDVI